MLTYVSKLYFIFTTINVIFFLNNAKQYVFLPPNKVSYFINRSSNTYIYKLVVRICHKVTQSGRLSKVVDLPPFTANMVRKL